MALTVDGGITASGTGVEAMGNPLTVVSTIARRLSQYDLGLEAGMVIMTGSTTKPWELPAGARSARAMFTTLGTVGVQFTTDVRTIDVHGD